MHYRDLAVRDVMSTAVIFAKHDESIGEADADMRIADIRHLPVIDDRERVIGILSNRDILAAMSKRRGKSVTVEEVMSTDVLTVKPDTPAREATALLLDHKIGSLPVVNDDNELVGIVTETDFLRIAHEVVGGDLLAFDDD